MHESLDHILSNMLFLYICGDQIEEYLGDIPYIFLYLFCGFAGSLIQIVITNYSLVPCIGASGAIAGIMGAYLIIHPTNKIRLLFIAIPIPVPAYIFISLWLIHNISMLTINFSDLTLEGVAYGAHLGGFLAGALTILILPDRNNRTILFDLS